MSTEPPTPTPPPTAITEVTPAHSGHALFGRILTILGKEGEFLVLELKDGINWITTRIHQSQVKMIVPPSAIVPATPPPAAVAPIIEPPAPEVNPS